MQMTPIGQIHFWICQAHAETIDHVERASEEQFFWQPHPAATSMAFNVWHLARWADYVQASVPEATPSLRQRLEPRMQVWYAEDLASAWSLQPTHLGLREGGTDMGLAAADLQLPSKATLLEYLRRCYALEEQAMSAIDEQQFQEFRQGAGVPPHQTVGYWLMNHLIHEWEHLGMIRYLAGLSTLSTLAAPE